MTGANLILGVRAECGKVVAGSGELDDDDINRQYPWILDLIADRITIKILRSFTTVANERLYAVNTNNNPEGVDIYCDNCGWPDDNRQDEEQEMKTHDLKVHPRDKILIAASHGRGIYVVDVSSIK